MNDSIPTIPLNSVETSPLTTKNFKDKIAICNNIIFKGHHGSYEILADQLIGMGGESQVFLAKRLTDGAEVVAKIYDQFQDNQLNRSNRKKVIEFIQDHSDYHKTHILPLLDHGTVTIPGETGEDDFRKPIDILPFCQDSEIKQASYSQLKNSIIPHIAQALHLMHQNNLVHRDIKPGNLYYYEKSVVLSDFGTSCEIAEETNSFHATTLRRGTVGFTAPEVWQGYAVIESDFYSLGCTLATLYLGKHPYQTLIQQGDMGAINRAINTHGLPLNCPSEHADLQDLINNLVLMEVSKRAGYDDILLWLKSSEAFRIKYASQTSNLGTDDFSFTFEDQICHTRRDLAKAVASHWDKSKDYLYRNIIGRFFSPIDPSFSEKIFNIVEDRETANDQNLGVAKLIYYLNNGGSLYWCGKSFDRLSDLSIAISAGKISTEEVADLLKSKYLSWRFLNRNDEGAKKVLPLLEMLEELATRDPVLAYHTTKYVLLPSGSEKNYNGSVTPDAIFSQLTRSTKDFYLKSEQNFLDKQLLAFLVAIGHRSKVLEFTKHLNGHFLKDLERFYLLFESITANPTPVRAHYILHGPYSHLRWLQKNLALYTFHSPAAHKIKENIERIALDPSMNITALSNGFAKLKEFEKDFKILFQDNILLAYLGIYCEKDRNGITATQTDAFYTEEFYGIRVPSGFLRTIESTKRANDLEKGNAV